MTTSEICGLNRRTRTSAPYYNMPSPRARSIYGWDHRPSRSSSSLSPYLLLFHILVLHIGKKDRRSVAIVVPPNRLILLMKKLLRLNHLLSSLSSLLFFIFWVVRVVLSSFHFFFFIVLGRIFFCHHEHHEYGRITRRRDATRARDVIPPHTLGHADTNHTPTP